MNPLWRDRVIAQLRRWDFGAQTRANAVWGAIARADPTLSGVVLTVDVWLGGQHFGFARRPVRTTSGRDGSIHTYLPGLLDDPELTSTLTLGQQSAEARSAEVALAAGALDLASLLQRGIPLAGLAEISYQQDGGDHDQRYVLMRGECTAGVSVDPTAAGAVVLSVTDFRTTQAALLPEYAVDTTRWPTTADSAIGLRYPVIINGYPKVPGVRVLDDHGGTGLYFLYSGPSRDLEATAAYVNGTAIASGGTGTYAPWTDTATTDGLSTPVRVIDFSSSDGPWEDGDTVYVDVGLTSGTPALGVVDVLQHLLGRYTGYGPLGLDLLSFGRARALGLALGFPKVLINASGSDAVNVLDFVESTYLASYPMLHLGFSGAGLGCTVLDRSPRPGRGGVDHVFTGGQGWLISRASDYTETARDERYNAFEVRYGYDAQDQQYTGYLSADAATSRACALSERYDGGRRPYTALESPLIHTDAQARTVLAWLIAHHTAPRIQVTWMAWPGAQLIIRPGQRVLFTDPDVSAFTSVRGYVSGVKASRTACELTFELWPNRSTSLWR